MTSKFTITFNSFEDGAVIKNIYACPENRQPHFAWKDYPDNTKCFAIIMDDADAISVVGHVFVHWNLFNIPTITTSIKEGQKSVEGSTLGMNHFSKEKIILGLVHTKDHPTPTILAFMPLTEG